MFIAFSLNEDYLISQTELMHKETKQKLPINGGLVEFSVNGKTYRFGISWLYTLSKYKVKPHQCILDNLNTIVFIKVKPCKSYLLIKDVVDGVVMHFRKPIFYKPGYRVIPGYTDYAISKQGDVVKLGTDKHYKPTETILNNYVNVVIHGDKVRLHRLIAAAWIPNPNIVEYQLINHKNGIKSDNRISNLEWCDNSINMTHSNMEGFNPQTQAVKMRNYRTGEIKEAHSLNEASRMIGLSYSLRRDQILSRLPSRPFGEWEIKLAEDDSAWYYEGKTELDKHGRYAVTVVEEDGSTKNFRDVNDFIKHYQLWNLGSSLPGLVEILRLRRPELKVHYESKGTPEWVKILDLETNVMREFSSLKKAADAIGISRTSITKACRANVNTVVCGRYICKFSRLDNGWWKPEYAPSREARTFEVTNTNTGEKTICESIKAAVRLTGIHKDMVKRAARDGDEVNGYLFREINKQES